MVGSGGHGLGRRPEGKFGSTPTFFAVATIFMLKVDFFCLESITHIISNDRLWTCTYKTIEQT